MNVPSGYTALDMIGFTDRGDYSPSANYVKNDLVHSGGGVWLCLVDDTTNITPAVGANWKIWINEAAYLSGLADTTITSPIDGQVLRYDIATNKWVNASVDSSPTQSSTNLVQSGGVYTQLANKANTSDLATVATTGAYSDLSGKPNLATVATSGSYNDLSNKPTLGTAATKDSTNAVTQNSTDLVESGAVYTETQSIKQALANKAPYLDIGLSGSSATLESDLNSKWASLPNGMYVVKIGNRSTIYHGTMFKYSDTVGSIQFMEADGTEYEYRASVGLTHPVLYFTSVACSATTGNFLTKSDANITADHVVAECTFANPSAITTDVTWTTANGSVTLNGTCASATTANLVLVKKGN